MRPATGRTRIPARSYAPPFIAAVRSLAGPCAEARWSGIDLSDVLAAADAGATDRRHAEAALAAAGRSLAEAIEAAERGLTDDDAPRAIASSGASGHASMNRDASWSRADTRA
jgi:hypothetical protein